ncbi:hypothetical protein GF325_06535 [Candidatus Bathyarchaeota archaeon]|nr:hypothetical protein [Candidatus Bathyarchaeota archaeon]
MGKDNITIIVSHTHWDREWYMSFQRMRFRLVAMMDQLLDLLENDKRFHSFMLDGQASPLDDYLEIREQQGRLETLVRSGKLIVGPFYVQCSPWLQTGEGYVKNLLEGHLKAEAFGNDAMKVAYIPDQFVHFAQMPQVFKGFGIKSIVFSRGMGNQQEEDNLGFEFNWKGPDGSIILGLHISEGYGQNTRLQSDPDEALNQVLFSKGAVNRYNKATRYGLMFSGNDHSLLQPVLPDVIELWNSIDEIVEDEGIVKHGSLEEFVNIILKAGEDLATTTGEIRGHRYQNSFQGVFSSFMPLKVMNFSAHDQLERYAEPLSLLARVLAGTNYEGYLSTGWSWLLKNQAHDSSWTASWEPVMDEMVTRFDWAIQIADEVKRWAFLDITSRIDLGDALEKQVAITCFNPSGFDRKESITVLLPSKAPLEEGFTLLDASGSEVQATITPRELGNEEIFEIRKFVESQGARPKYYYTVHTEPVLVPSVGYTTLLMVPGTRLKDSKNPEKERIPGKDLFLKAGDTTVENDVIRIEFNQNGTFNMKDKRTDHVFEELNYFEDISDVGDGYQFIPIIGDSPITTKHLKANIEKAIVDPYAATYLITMDLEVPAGANKQHNWRLDGHETLTIKSRVTLQAGNNPRVDVNVQFTNTARDHKLSVTFPTGLRAREVEVDGHFGCTPRGIKLPEGEKWKVQPEPRGPQHKFVNLTDYSGEKGLLIANKGLPEYEANLQDDETVNLGLTLMRAFGRWGVHVHENSPVTMENAQLQGKHEYEYALIPHQGDIFKRAYAGALAFRYPLHVEYKGAYNKYQGYFPNIDQPDPFLPPSRSFFKISPLPLVLSIVKKAGRSGDLILRVFNASNTEEVLGTIETSLDLKKVELVDLNEHEIEGTGMVLESGAHSISMKVAPAKIVSLKLTLA